MVTDWFNSPSEWVTHVQRLVHEKDLDNVVLFAGDPGNGKSTLMVQIAKALDPSFSVDRIHFSIKSLLEDARNRSPGQCVAADELLVNRRKSMTKDNVDLIEFLQVCRALNLHILLCFPHAAMLDRGVLDRRVRYRFDVPSQGTALLKERIFHTIRDVSGREDYHVVWKDRSPPWRFARNSGSFWEEYLAKKISAARMRDAIAKVANEDELTIGELPVRKDSRSIEVREKKSQGAGPKFLSRAARAGRHPKGCGSQFPCPTDYHLPE